MMIPLRVVAACIRRDILAAIAADTLPGKLRANYSVRIARRIAAGDSIVVTAHHLPGVVRPCCLPGLTDRLELNTHGDEIRRRLGGIAARYDAKFLVRMVDEEAERVNAEAVKAYQQQIDQAQRDRGQRARGAVLSRALSRFVDDFNTTSSSASPLRLTQSTQQSWLAAS